jgi:PAS domain S-box-containing protein
MATGPYAYILKPFEAIELKLAIQMAIYKKKMERKLEESEKNYRELVDNSMVAIYKTNPKGEILFANEAMAEMLGFESVEELKTKKTPQLYKNSEDRKTFIKKLIKNGKFRNLEVDMITNTGKTITILLNAHLENNIISGMMMDITSKIKSKKRLEKSVLRFRALAENAADGIITTNVHDKILYFNNSLLEMFGYSKDELRHFQFKMLMPRRYRENFMKGIRKFRSTDEHKLTEKTIETVGLKKNGTEFPLEMSLTKWEIDRNIYFTSIIRDITERKKHEKYLKESLAEKTVLLKEIHHRVKNNMQIISSLLSLQEQYVTDDEVAVDVLKESQNRVKSMAIVHEKLYQSKDLTHIKFYDYIQRLVLVLFSSYGITEDQIKPVINVEDLMLNIETAVPFGLIISELISNSLKYAFPERKKGELKLSLKKPDDTYELIISDDGIGFPEDLDYKKTDSLGLRLVNILVGQIDGTISMNTNHGTEFKIIFKELEYKKRI